MKRSWQRVHVEKAGPTTKISSEIGFLFANWAIPEKRWGLRTYFFEITTGISRFVTLSLESLDEAKLHPWKSCKIVWHILGMKLNYLWFFLNCPWKFYLFLIEPQETPYAISSIFLENPSPGKANFMTSQFHNCTNLFK